MAKLEYATSFRDLIVYQKARELSLEIFRITKRFPREETYSLTDQIRRSSRSMGAQKPGQSAGMRNILLASLLILMGSNRKLSIGSRLRLTVNMFLEKRQEFFLRNVARSVVCWVG